MAPPPAPMKTPHLDRVPTPKALRQRPAAELRAIADELRAETIDAVSTPVAIWAPGWVWWS